MEYKILESLGTEIENVDDAALNNFFASGRSGIMKGILDECQVVLPSSNSISISTGELLIQGFRVKITTPISYSFVASSAGAVNYHIIARLVLKQNREVTVEIVRREQTSLQQDNLFKNESGTYELELVKFVHSGSSIIEVNVTAELIEIVTKTYNKTEIDNMFKEYISSINKLIGGEL